jgi:hypothetical protein
MPKRKGRQEGERGTTLRVLRTHDARRDEGGGGAEDWKRFSRYAFEELVLNWSIADVLAALPGVPLSAAVPSNFRSMNAYVEFLRPLIVEEVAHTYVHAHCHDIYIVMIFICCL